MGRGISPTYQLLRLAENVAGIPLAGGSGRMGDVELAEIDAAIAPVVLRRRLIAVMAKDAYEKGEGKKERCCRQTRGKLL